MMMNQKTSGAAIAFAAFLASAIIAHGEDCATRTVQVVVSYPIGSRSNTVARLVLESLGMSMGHQFMIDPGPEE